MVVEEYSPYPTVGWRLPVAEQQRTMQPYIVGVDELAATDVVRVDYSAWPKQERVLGLWRLVVDRSQRLTPQVSLVPILPGSSYG